MVIFIFFILFLPPSAITGRLAAAISALGATASTPATIISRLMTITGILAAAISTPGATANRAGAIAGIQLTIQGRVGEAESAGEMRRRCISMRIENRRKANRLQAAAAAQLVDNTR